LPSQIDGIAYTAGHRHKIQNNAQSARELEH
jgi:hypothetical protein